MEKMVNKNNELIGYMFYCPGCEIHHAYYINHPDNKLVWNFNGDLKNPTFSPSLRNNYPDGKTCHLFVRNGKIEYCNDSFHSLKGKVVSLP